jgi:hypothetical protein
LRTLSFGLVFCAVFSTSSFASDKSFTDEQICKSAIATIMGRNISIMNTKTKADEVWLNYIRPQDKKSFEYRCEINHDKGLVNWRTKVDGKWGRWRNYPDDPVIRFEIRSNQLTVREIYAPTDFTENKFKKSDF